MKVYKLKREMTIPVPIERAWSFFSDPGNLKVISPPEMNFVVLTEPLPDNIHSGLLIEYSLTPLFGIRTKWITEIKEVNEPFFFIDEQKSGPYSLWRHKHSFVQTNDGTHMTDEIEYSIPYSFIGNIANALIVKNKLDHIFKFRKKRISELFSSNNIPVA
jgi:ligand-binding SRPBCC domain-containing protein